MSISNGDILGQVQEESDVCEVVCTLHSNCSCVNLISEYGLFSVTGSVTFEADTDWITVEVYSHDGTFVDKKIICNGKFEVREAANMFVAFNSLSRAVSLWRLVDKIVREDVV